MLSYIDAHVHLQADEYNCDRAAVIKRATDAGVRRFLCAGLSPEDWASLKQLAEACPQITAGYGIHPWEVENLPENWLTILETNLAGAGFIGEIGLDRLLAKTDFALQNEVFKTQLNLASKLKKPVVIHCLKAHNELLEALNRQKERQCFILHSYSGSREMAEEFVKLGAYFSFGAGALRAGSKAVKCVKEIPLDRILIETDSPYMTPPEEYIRQDILKAAIIMKNGRLRNEPANVELAYRKIADLRQIPLESLCCRVESNINRFLLNQEI